MTPSPYVVDMYGIRERRPGEAEQRQMSSKAMWERFERKQRERDACRHVAACARAIAILAGDETASVRQSVRARKAA